MFDHYNELIHKNENKVWLQLIQLKIFKDVLWLYFVNLSLFFFIGGFFFAFRIRLFFEVSTLATIPSN
jgi:hypothetical protein